jgi:1-acyl-sn-glycerol-3-phosphate acyltransferase
MRDEPRSGSALAFKLLVGRYLRFVRPSPVYSLIAILSAPVLRTVFRLRATGKENLPNGPFVLAANHLSNLDPWPLGIPIWPRRYLRFMAKSELYWWPLSVALNAGGAFPVNRGRADVEAIRTAVQLCRDGNIVVMFPEGTRRRKGLRKRWEARPRTGAARIALEARVPLVPAAVKGTDRLARLGPLRVAYGAPLDLSDLDGRHGRAAAQEATERLMERIAQLEESLD